MLDGITFIADGPSSVPCDLCEGPVVEYSIPSNIWNAIVRLDSGEIAEEYLCIWCLVRILIARWDRVTGR